jgi:hypothetical protein
MDAVAVYEGRTPPSATLGNLSVAGWARDRLAKLANTAVRAPDSSVYWHAQHLTDELNSLLNSEAPLTKLVKRLSGARRPRDLAWSAHVNATDTSSRVTYTVDQLSIRASPYGCRHTRTGVTVIRAQDDALSATHRQMIVEAGASEVEGLVLLVCDSLGRVGAAGRRSQYHDRVIPQYATLMFELRNAGVSLR